MSSSNVKKGKKANNKDSFDENGKSINDLTKEETEIARFLRLKCPNKQGNLVGMKVNFFIASKLIDCLMESKWGPGPASATSSTATAVTGSNQKPNKKLLFTNRAACASFMQGLMNKQLFYRVVKVYKENNAKDESGTVTTVKDSTTDNTPNIKKRKTKKESADSEPKSDQTPSSSSSSTSASKETQAKRKFKLEMHEVQTFMDANEPYVWIYDPTSTTTYIIGFLLILGSIGICLFPLWPSQVREGVYYLSLAGISVLGAILGLAAFKYILFGLLWVVTFGKFHFWLFPNLTEDVGFFESFSPVYQIGSTPASKSQINNKTVKSSNENKDLINAQATDDTNKQKLIDHEENLVEGKTENLMTESTIKRQQVPETEVFELSKSTVEIKSSSSIYNINKDSPILLTKSIRNLNGNEDEDFELVNDDDLEKS